MTAIDRDLDALVRACWDNAEERTSQLALADYLGENPLPDVVCPKCIRGIYTVEGKSCPTCSGTGRIPDTTHQQREELIRVSVELEQRKDEYDSYDLMKRAPSYEKLDRRRDSLQAALSRWPCPGVGKHQCYDGKTYTGPGGGQRAEETCLTCGGSGDVLVGRHRTDTVKQFPLTWLAGYPQFATLPRLVGDAVEEDTTSSNPLVDVVYRPTPRLVALCGMPPWGIPLEGVIVADRKPEVFHDGSAGWYKEISHGGQPYRLPATLWDMLTDYEPDYIGKLYPTATLAIHSLARAILKFGKGGKS